VSQPTSLLGGTSSSQPWPTKFSSPMPLSGGIWNPSRFTCASGASHSFHTKLERSGQQKPIARSNRPRNRTNESICRLLAIAICLRKRACPLCPPFGRVLLLLLLLLLLIIRARFPHFPFRSVGFVLAALRACRSGSVVWPLRAFSCLLVAINQPPPHFAVESQSSTFRVRCSAFPLSLPPFPPVQTPFARIRPIRVHPWLELFASSRPFLIFVWFVFFVVPNPSANESICLRVQR